MTDNFLDQLSHLPHYLGNHLSLTVIALAAGIAISLPLAILVAKVTPVRWPILSAAGVIQTIPSLALLALMVPLLTLVPGVRPFGFWPAVIALTLYSILPILRNTVTGIVEVDLAMTEAARGLGMTARQMLFRVELPLAAAVIVAGIRTAAVWVVGMATLSTPIGQTSLGNYIFSGLQTRNWTALLFGCVAAAVLAILLDSLIGLVESGTRRRRRGVVVAGSVALVVVLVGGAMAPALVRWAAPSRTFVATGTSGADGTPGAPIRPEFRQDERAIDRTIRVGAKTFTEQLILAQLLEMTLRDAGFDVERMESLGSTMAFDAVRTGDVDVYVEYSGTAWANYMRRNDGADRWKVMDVLSGWMAQEHGIRVLGELGFENAYALAMRRDRAESHQIRTLADLAASAPDMRIGGDYEIFSRPEWLRVSEAYGLRFAESMSYDPAFMYQAVSERDVDVITAFSSDGRIAAFDLVVLEDPLQAFPPYDAVLFLSPAVANDRQIVEALEPLIRSIDVETMREANRMVDVDGRTVGDAARWLREAMR